VIGFAEALAAPEVVWSLVDQGFQVLAFARRGKRTALHHSRHVKCFDITPPEEDLKAALSELHAHMVSLHASFSEYRHVLFPLDDTAVWICSSVSLDPDWMLAGPCGDNVSLALDKYVQVQAAYDAGLRVPNTMLAITSQDILGTRQSFPLILKPAKGITPLENRLYRGRSWICGNREELEHAAVEWANRAPLVVQPFILGRGEGVFGIATSKGVRAWSSHRRIRMMNPHGSGSSACISQRVSEDLKPPIERLIERAGWHGLFMIEFLRDRSGTAWFMELNGRPWGSLALARRQGLEYPSWNVMLVTNAQSDIEMDRPGDEGLVCRHLGREFMYPLFVLRGPKSKALSNWPSFWKAARDVLLVRYGDTFYNWRRDDPKVMLSDFFYTIRDQVFKKKR